MTIKDLEYIKIHRVNPFNLFGKKLMDNLKKLIEINIQR